MLKSAFIGTCMLICMVDAVPAPGRGALKGYCKTNEHCKKKECCVSFDIPRGKRAAKTLSEDLKRFVDGKCEKRGKSGSACLVRDFESLVKDIYYLSCPCLVGHSCSGTGQITPPLGELGTCVKECSSGAECKKSECCVSNTTPKGKRSASHAKRQASGHCEPMGTSGSECLVNNGSGKPRGVVLRSCPCTKFMSCVGTGNFEAPLGELGRCQNYRRGRGE